MVTSQEYPFAKTGSKYFIGCKNNEDNTLLWFLFQKMGGVLKIHDEIEPISLLLEDNLGSSSDHDLGKENSYK